MPWTYTNHEFINAIKELKKDFLQRLSLDDKKSDTVPEIFKDNESAVKVKCLQFMTLYQDCLEQTNNDTEFCMPYYKLFSECKDKHTPN
tara:strand:+ start:2931 stop:3197 length:267 start_codon:yes stop_codon:yes gene_type:complete